MPRAELTLPGAVSSVPTARRFVDSLLTSWGQPEAAWSAAMCVSELAGNCALHARTEFTISVELADDVVRIEVRDGSLRIPTQRGYDTGATTGRGLRLVEAYARSWGVEVGSGAAPSGKTVWVLLDAQPAAGRSAPEDEDASTVDALLAAFGDDQDGAGEGRVESCWRAA